MNATTYPETVALARPDPSMIRSAEQQLAHARSAYMVIATADDCEAAAEDLKAIKSRQKALEDARTTITKPLLEAQRAVNALFKGPQDMLTQAEQIVKRGILAYQDAEDRKRREAEAAAAEVARKEREKLEAQAAKATAAGKVERAEALTAAAASIPERIAIASAAPKLGGVSSKTTWRAEVTDKATFIAYVAQHPEWLQLVDVNMTALNGLARSQKAALALPGVKAMEEKNLAARSA
jgi:hypothetical protein